jgi:N-acetylglutamate synthase-like GNAT family acetyltransferase
MIRKATRYDLPILVEMVKQYAKEFPSELAKQDRWIEEQHIQQLLMTMIAGCGFVLIDDDKRGFLAAIVLPNLWYPKLTELCELAWWVTPEHRNSTIGGKLWVAFDKEAETMMQNGRVQYVKTSLSAESPAINYEKRGYKKLETSYIKE